MPRRIAAHRLRNKIATIASCTEWAISQLPASSPARPCLDDILRTCGEAAELLGQEQGAAGTARSNAARDAASVILSCLPALRALLPSNVRLELGSIPPSASLTSGTDVSSLLMRSGQAAAAVIGDHTGSLRLAVSLPAAKGPTELELDVARDGEALPRSEVASAIASVARRLGLAARCIDGSAAGVTIRVALPTLETELRCDSIGMVLIVEDDELLLASQVRLLRDQGIQTIPASNARDALEQIEKHGDSIDLLVLDLELPDARGEWVLQQVREWRSAIPVIVATGEPTRQVIERCATDEMFTLLRKPFSTDRLVRLIRGFPRD